MRTPTRIPRTAASAARLLTSVGASLLCVALSGPGCTHDFSEFDVSGQAVSNGGTPSAGGSDAGGTTGDGSMSSGGSISAGGMSAGGTSSSGGAGGATGGGNGTGGVTSSGGAPATGGGTSSGGAPATGGGTSSGGRGGTGGATGGSTGTGGSNGGAGGASDAGVPCNTLFGAVPGYLLCAETATTCEFLYATTTRETCQTICPMHAGACVSATNGNPGSCTVVGTATCTTPFTDAICLCSKL